MIDKQQEKNTSKVKRYRPKIGITIGDFNGIGPEIIIKALDDRCLNSICVPVIYGSEKILTKYKRLLGLGNFDYYQLNANRHINNKKVNMVNCWIEDFEIEPGKQVTNAAHCALLALNRSTEDLRNSMIDAVVTCPISKHNMQSEEFSLPGHTEYYTQKFGKLDSLMLMCNNEGLRVGVATGHIPLHTVSKTISKDLILDKIMTMYHCLREDFGIVKPKIAALSLNPHTGENGLLGNEEEKIIKPVIIDLKKRGHLLYGPLAADGLFGSGEYIKFDGILAMYHDQGLIPFKTLSFNEGVNYTAGLPVVRTCPAHGTAFNIAGKGIADEGSLQKSIFLACDIVKKRKNKVDNKLRPNQGVKV